MTSCAKLTVRCVGFKPLRQNSLVGFAKIEIAELRMVIHDVGIYQKDSLRWCCLPGKPQIDKAGNVIKGPSGKPRYSILIEFTSNEVGRAFSQRVFAAIEAYEPMAFSGEEAYQ
jgi:hypothetical protein